MPPPVERIITQANPTEQNIERRIQKQAAAIQQSAGECAGYRCWRRGYCSLLRNRCFRFAGTAGGRGYSGRGNRYSPVVDELQGAQIWQHDD